jgi:hypothetical protein
MNIALSRFDFRSSLHELWYLVIKKVGVTATKILSAYTDLEQLNSR